MFLGHAVNSSNLVHRVVPGRPGPGRPSAVKVRIHQHGEFAVAICQDTPNLSISSQQQGHIRNIRNIHQGLGGGESRCNQTFLAVVSGEIKAQSKSLYRTPTCQTYLDGKKKIYIWVKALVHNRTSQKSLKCVLLEQLLGIVLVLQRIFSVIFSRWP